MRCNNLSLVLGLGLVRVSSRVRVKVRVSVLVRVSIRTSWMVNFALFRCYRPVIYTRPMFVYTIQPGLTTGLTTCSFNQLSNRVCQTGLTNTV